MRTALMLLALLAVPALAGQTVWKWVDEKGVTHYSDQPVPGAQRVEIAVGSRANPPNTTPSYSSSSSPSQPAAGYRNFEVLKPRTDDVYINTAGTVEVRIAFEPELQTGHTISLFLNRTRVPDFPPNAQEFTLQNVPRGTHTLVALIQDQRGATVQETPPVTFTVRQESIANPPVGPSLRPPPRPQPRN